MAWAELTRRQDARAGNRYASDLTAAEWAVIAPLMPPVRATGRPRRTHLRDTFDAPFYIATAGCQWRMPPNDYRPVSTARGHFYAWRNGDVPETTKRPSESPAKQSRRVRPTQGFETRFNYGNPLT